MASRSFDPSSASTPLPRDSGLPAVKRRRKTAVQAHDAAGLDLESGVGEPTASALDVLRKPVNTLAIVPKSARITSLGRKSYNVLLYEAQEQGLDKEVFRAPLERVVKGVDFDSNDHALIKKHLRAMVSTTVEWQSPTTGEGSAWNVSGLLAHAKLTKERGQVWVEWSYAVNLKQELLEPTVFARLKLEVLSQLRSHAGIALYEICTRYKDIGRTARQPWRWWHPVLSGQPETARTAQLEYRVFKRDTLKPALAEVSTLTDLEVELLEHKAGRFISEIQFLIRPKAVVAAPRSAPRPVDMGLLGEAQRLGVPAEQAESLLEEHGAEALRAGLAALANRVASGYPAPLRDPYRYLRSLMPGVVEAVATESAPVAERAKPAATPIGVRPGMASAANEGAAQDGAPTPRSEDSVELRELRARRQARWTQAWMQRRRQEVVQQIAGLSQEEQAGLVAALHEDMVARQMHPSIRKRLQAHGWQHPMVLTEMVRFYALGAMGPMWDKPSAEQLLALAMELGDVG